MKLKNETFVTEFILEGFPGSSQIQISLFILLFMVYIATLGGNILIIVIICLDHRLHSPMYFFLVNLSFLETFCIAVVVPKVLLNYVTDRNSISFAACNAQSYLYFYLYATDFFLLTVMSMDRYVAICHPLHYSTIMSSRICISLVLGCWVSAFFFLLPTSILIHQLPFCGPNVIEHFFCDASSMLTLVCADTQLIKLMVMIVASTVLLGPLVLTILSYIYIISTMLRMQSIKGQQKAFSTCTSHLTMVCLVFGSALFISVRPMQSNWLYTNKVVSVVSSIFTPLLNPFIYTLRNEKVKKVLRDLLHSKNSKKLDF
ncbi:olfactory receptor 6T1-like [Microcaecilia unicolor]|uniref:Olfactory receptor n=1 Tax=Microcaecilia unicolor TaxID=1415580 RepID=A0A6P7WXF1_9AMPH|nr:olfactory receptor 6T1-like [Microcaecilia unicolor]